MSALRSNKSSKGNIEIFYTNQPKSTNRQRQKSEKVSSNYSSSAVGIKEQSTMQITFQKTEEKLKKNLAREFQTFNMNSQQIKNHSQKYENGKEANFKKYNHEKSVKSQRQQEMTTQAKSPLVKSNYSSKSKLAQNKQKQGELQKFSKTKQYLKKSREKSNRSNKSKSPTQYQRSRKSSPQVSPAYSKLSTSEKRAFSKSKLSKNEKIQQQNKPNQAQIAKGFTKMSVSNIENNPSMSFTNNKSNLTKQKLSSPSNNQQYQLSFPHMITESQSVYPSSSYPNTGKLSMYQYNSGSVSEENSNIAEELGDQNEDYISEGREGQGQGMQYVSEGEQVGKDRFTLQSGYQQFPMSYLLAMEILQAKVNQQQKQIQNLHKQLSTENTKYQELYQHVNSLQSTLQQKQQIIAQKDTEIKFLKGYLNEQKQNNREVLKEIAKNVYVRTVSAKKEIRENEKMSENKPKKQLFVESHNPYNLEPSSQVKLKKFIPASNSRPDLIDKLIQPQLQNRRQLNQSLQRQHLLKEQLQKQQLIKDEMMREQILKEEQLKQQSLKKKKYDYLDNSRRSNSGKVVYGNQNTMKKSRKQDQVTGEKYDCYGQLYSDGSRLRSMSTGVKQDQSGFNTYRPRNISQSNNPIFGYTHNAFQSSNKTPLKHSLIDPALQKYIQAKSQIISSNHRYPQSNTHHYLLQNPNNQSGDLKNQKKNKKTVSKMRELMRAEKQMIKLNYRLEAIEKRILQCVNSNGKENDIEGKSLNEQVNEKLLLEDLQKQYALIKKEFQRKEANVKELKTELQLKI